MSFGPACLIFALEISLISKADGLTFIVEPNLLDLVSLHKFFTAILTIVISLEIIII